MEIDIFDAKRALEGNVFLARIEKKIPLANDRFGFMVNIGEGMQAFLNSYDPVLKDANMSEGQSVVVQVFRKNTRKKVHALFATFSLPEHIWFFARLNMI